MIRSASERPAARWPRGLLGMIGLVLIAEAFIGGLRDDLIRPLGESWRFAARAAETESPGCDVLCFGDSLVKYGVLPGSIEARTGLRSYNLASSGGTAPSSFFLLRKALDAGARPKGIIVDFATLMPVVDGPPKLLHYPELATARDCLELAKVAHDPGFFGTAMVARMFPSARYRFEIRVAVLKALEGRSGSERNSVRSHRLIWTRERGAQPTERSGVRLPQPVPLIDGLCPVDWCCPPTDERFVDRFLALAGAHGIPVYWLLPPLAPEVSERRAVRGSDGSYERFVHLVAARHQNVIILDARHSGYDGSAFIDPIHLDRRGAEILTSDIASRMLDDLAGRGRVSQWVALPGFGDRSAGVARVGEAGSVGR